MSTKDKKLRAAKMLEDARAVLKRADDLQAQARGAKDIVQLNCVEEKRTQIQGLTKISEQASTRMEAAIAQSSNSKVNHEFTKMLVAGRKIGNLKAELEQCVGKLAVHAGDTQVEIVDQPTADTFDPTEAPAPTLGPAVPPIASSF